ncbi:hypothetical protein HPB50_002188 [Hyalomma asiaticum]|uniref:Uncharacterized protein n=1 Tax=Hyalomma asiaticum TaxID=266040 RepID=A0ACB7TH57_HYAAI|nr:hypothetical protein HPB50_002188 [Hyalomma asiaticum]
MPGRSVGRSTAVDKYEIIMCEEEAEQAAASEAALRSAYNQDATKEGIAYGLQESAMSAANAGVYTSCESFIKFERRAHGTNQERRRFVRAPIPTTHQWRRIPCPCGRDIAPRVVSLSAQGRAALPAFGPVVNVSRDRTDHPAIVKEQRVG